MYIRLSSSSSVRPSSSSSSDRSSRASVPSVRRRRPLSVRPFRPVRPSWSFSVRTIRPVRPSVVLLGPSVPSVRPSSSSSVHPSAEEDNLEWKDELFLTFGHMARSEKRKKQITNLGLDPLLCSFVVSMEGAEWSPPSSRSRASSAASSRSPASSVVADSSGRQNATRNLTKTLAEPNVGRFIYLQNYKK